MCNMSSWFIGECKNCGYKVIVTQPTEYGCDYWWYCSNKQCKNHHPGEQKGDTDGSPSWVTI